MIAKVENACARKKTQRVKVDASERVCVNCVWYEQYYRQSRTNIMYWEPTSTGYCLLHDQRRGPLREPCKEFETETGDMRI